MVIESDYKRNLLLFVTLGLVFLFIIGIEEINIRPSPRVPIVVPTKGARQ